jgi:hypothetical protein
MFLHLEEIGIAITNPDFPLLNELHEIINAGRIFSPNSVPDAGSGSKNQISPFASAVDLYAPFLYNIYFTL